MIEDKIDRYKSGIATAKKLSKNKHADQSYYSELISKFEKMLKFYEDLKVWRKYTESSN